jgi:hypothetical protein
VVRLLADYGAGGAKRIEVRTGRSEAGSGRQTSALSQLEERMQVEEA